VPNVESKTLVRKKIWLHSYLDILVACILLAVRRVSTAADAQSRCVLAAAWVTAAAAETVCVTMAPSTAAATGPAAAAMALLASGSSQTVFPLVPLARALVVLIKTI
jgi:hypothetical protein